MLDSPTGKAWLKKISGAAYILVPILWALFLLQWVEYLDRYPMDSYNYLVLAESLAQGNGYTIQGTPHSTFLIGYPLHLALGVWAGVDLSFLAKGLALGFGMGVLILVFNFGKDLLGRGEGWMAMVLLAAWPMFGRWCMAPMSEPPFAFYSLAALLLAWWGAGRRSMVAVLFAFAIGGFTAIIRYQGVLLWLPLCGLVLARWKGHAPGEVSGTGTPPGRRWRQYLCPLLFGTLLFALPLGLWLMRNWVVLGSPYHIQYFDQIPDYKAGHYSNLSGWRYALGQLAFGFVRFPLADMATTSLPGWFSAFRFGMLILYWAAVAGGTVRALLHRRWDLLALVLWVVELHVFHLFWPFREDRFYMSGFPIVCLLGVYAAGRFYTSKGSTPVGTSPVDAGSPQSAETHAMGNSGPDQRVSRRRHTFWLLGAVAALLFGFSPIVYRMQLIGLRTQSYSALAQAAGEEIRARGSWNDRIATTLDPVETYYYARRPTVSFRSADDLQRILQDQEKRWKTSSEMSLWIVLPDHGVPPEILNAVQQITKAGLVAESYGKKTDRPVGLIFIRLKLPRRASSRPVP